MSSLNLSRYEIEVDTVIRNAPPARLYDEALEREPGTALASSGALISYSGEKTGRTPEDKRVVENPESRDEIWWGDINIPLDPEVFQINRRRAVDYLNTQDRLYVVDAFAGWDPDYSLKVRIVTSRAYHALFMHNMLRRPTDEELENFGEPDFVIFNAGEFPANPHTQGMTSDASIDLDFDRGEMVILGTEYAGEMKKGIFTLMHYLMPDEDVLSMHCSCNEGEAGDVSLFFGLSGTGKTTLSSDPNRKLVGDDEHCWTENGVFNIEGGCYAKTIDLSRDEEPIIYDAIDFGAILENVVYDEETREVDFTDDSITQNTRTSYPIDHVENAKIPCVADHPDNIIFLTCDAFGILPPVSKLSPEQAMYHFISGYTAKVAGTEVGITEPEATFSAGFGAAFLARHPTVYAELLADKMRRHDSEAWLVSTGWTGGKYGTGHRIDLPYTRSIIDGIHSGELKGVPTTTDDYFGLEIPEQCPGVPNEVLLPWETWDDQDAYDETARKLVGLFDDNFDEYRDRASREIVEAGPSLP
ncbi:MAG: phosphoenolpyruvate carboxykinase (ATP) [Bradymonadaceae bacterium]